MRHGRSRRGSVTTLIGIQITRSNDPLAITTNGEPWPLASDAGNESLDSRLLIITPERFLQGRDAYRILLGPAEHLHGQSGQPGGRPG
jgi:hypothetical protein